MCCMVILPGAACWYMLLDLLFNLVTTSDNIKGDLSYRLNSWYTCMQDSMTDLRVTMLCMLFCLLFGSVAEVTHSGHRQSFLASLFPIL